MIFSFVFSENSVKILSVNYACVFDCSPMLTSDIIVQHSHLLCQHKGLSSQIFSHWSSQIQLCFYYYVFIIYKCSQRLNFGQQKQIFFLIIMAQGLMTSTYCNADMSSFLIFTDSNCSLILCYNLIWAAHFSDLL